MNEVRPYENFQPCIGKRVMIDPTGVVIGDVVLGDDASVWPTAVIRGDVNKITIGARTNIQDGSILHVTHRQAAHPEGYPLTIGSDVTIGHKVLLHGCAIGNQVLVGMGTIILDGAVVENEVVVGAGSLVTQGKRLNRGYLYYGNPIRQIRRLTPPEIENLLYSAQNYVKWKNLYLAKDSQTKPHFYCK